MRAPLAAVYNLAAMLADVDQRLQAAQCLAAELEDRLAAVRHEPSASRLALVHARGLREHLDGGSQLDLGFARSRAAEIATLLAS